MSERKHTPGPWGFRRHLKTTYVCQDCSTFRDPWYLHGNKNNSDFLADLFLKDDGNQVENMQLIAAAPCLLAACEAARNMIRPIDDENDTVGTRVLNMLEAAIAKATGGQQ